MANANALGKLIQGGLKALEKKGGLSMEPEARMARAKEMGFDTEKPWYHGTDSDITAFKNPSDSVGTHFGTAGQANTRLEDLKQFEQSGITGERVMPVFMRANKPLRVDDVGHDWDWRAVLQQLPRDEFGMAEIHRVKDLSSLRKLIQSKGYDSLVYKNEGEVPGKHEYYERLGGELPNNPSKKRIQEMHDTLDRYIQDNAEDSMIPLDPSHVRSVNAAFDPKRINSRDILAGGVPVAGAVGAAQQDEEGYAGGGAVTKLIQGGLRAIRGEGPMIAYHGSEHPFDKFDMSKIGTGEGNNTRGYGLYLTEKEGNARGYRDVLATDPTNAPETIDFNVLEKLKAREKPDVQKEIERFINGDGYADRLRLTANQIGSPRLQKYLEPHFADQGHMYEVKINADPDAFNVLQMPLYKQSQAMQDAAGRIYGRDLTPPDELQAKFTKGGGWKGGYADPSDRLAVGSGWDLYQAAAQKFGGIQAPLSSRYPGHSGFDSDTSQKLIERGPDIAAGLRENGIVGQVYYDRSPRVGSKAHEVVMFDDNPLEIQRRYARGGRIDPRELPPEPQASSPQLPATIDGMSPPIDFLGQSHGQTPGQTWGDTTPDYESQPIEERIRQLRQPGIPGAPAWGGDLSGVDRRRMVPPRPVRKADGGEITEQQPMELPDGVSESELRAALAYLAKMQRHEEV